MTPALWAELRHLLEAALEVPPADRAAYLDRICAGKPPETRRELESLLAATDEEFLEKPIASLLDSPKEAPAIEPAPARIGLYSIEEELGRGGMGTVYRATRDDGEFLTAVAIKVLNRGMDTDYFVQRFRYERQLLAYLDHPSIVRLLDGGSTPDGRPYLVTELVEGQPLRDYCAALSLQERLRLMVAVCDAVQHAHQRLILHCDLKPGNVLVTREGQPKLLDFGVGRMFAPSLGSAAQTRAAKRIFTPGYASPEQVRGEPLTTASDVFSLGAMLFEILTGRPPFDHALDNSTRRTADLASAAPAGPGALPPALLRGEVDLIIEKALRAEPALRYESAEQLAADLRRFLAGEPIAARPITARYKLRKFVGRNRALVLASTAAVLALVTATGVALWQRSVAIQERDTARRLYENSRELARAFVFEVDDRLRVEGATGARKLIVERGLKALDQLAAQDPKDAAVQRDLVAAYLKMGDVLGRHGGPNLGRTDDAMRSYARALALCRKLNAAGATGQDRVTLAEALIRVAGLVKNQGHADQAVGYGTEAVRLLQGDSSPAARKGLAAAYFDLGGTYSQLGRWEEVLQIRRQALTLAETIAAQSHALEDQIRVTLSRTRLGSILNQLQRHPEAEREFARAIAEARATFRAHPTRDTASDTLSNALFFAGINASAQRDWVTAKTRFHEAYALRQERAQRDPTDWRTKSLAATALLRLGMAEVALGETQSGLARLRESRERRIELAAADPGNSGARAEIGEAWARLALALPDGPERHQALGQAHAVLDPMAARGELNQVLIDLWKSLPR